MSEVLGYGPSSCPASQVAAYVYGYPDVGLLGLNEMVESVRRIANVCRHSQYSADADTGYGNAVNVYYTVKEYIRAGAAGLHIEDQESPKKSGTLAGRRLISREEAVGKYRAAGSGKKNWIRTLSSARAAIPSAPEGGNFEDAVQRSIAYVKEAGLMLFGLTRSPSGRRLKSLPAHTRAGNRALLRPAAVADVRRISETRRRGGFIPEPHDCERPAGDLGIAPRIQRTRSCRAG